MERLKLMNKDRPPFYYTIQNDINKLTSEIVRLSRLPYSSKQNMARIRSVDNQIMYLEEVLAAFERDSKKL
jgi:hypothetical protein